MSETIHQTQPNQPVSRQSKKFSRWLWGGVMAIVLALAISVLAGVAAGRTERLNAEAANLNQLLQQQFDLGVQDLAEGRYDAARQRFEFIALKNPNFPGIVEKIAELMLKTSITPTPVPTPVAEATPTPDLGGAQAVFERAIQLLISGDWNGTLIALDELRKTDSSYKTAVVDGVYYITLRNRGIDRILKEGNLEGGMYDLSRAETFGPLDGYAAGIRTGARFYVTGASFWELDWEQALFYFRQVYSNWPGLWDSASGMTSTDRFRVAASSHADFLVLTNRHCDAEILYREALAVRFSAELEQKANEAGLVCSPPTPTALPTLEATPEVTPEATPVPTATP